ncbi:hypothetical protein AHAS_Ahas10G0028500 [Arachis hypogaea]
MWRIDLMPNSGTLNPLSIIKGTDATLSERRNVFLNDTITLGQDSQQGKEKFNETEKPTGISLATTNHGRHATEKDFTSGQKHQTATVEIGSCSEREGLHPRQN